MAQQPETIKAAAIEKQFNEIVSLYIYAAIDDIKANWNGTERYPEVTHQNYKNLATPKANRAKDVEGKDKKLTSIFNISTEVKQLYSKMFEMMIQELKNIEITDNDTLTTITTKLGEANTDCCSKFMFEIGAEYKPKFGLVLTSAADVGQYFHARILGQLPQYKNKVVIMALISHALDQFLKATAWIVAKQQWYNQCSVSQGYFLGLLASLNMDQVLLDLLMGGVRKKEVKARKSPAAKEATGTTPAKTPGENPAPVAANTNVNELANLLDDI